MKAFKYILIIAIILSSLSLFYLRGLGIVVRLMDVFTVILILISLLSYILYSRLNNPIKPHFSISIFILLAGVIISSLSAYYFNHQSWGITLYQQRHMYAFLFYFLLFFLAPKPEWIVNTLFYMGIVTAFFFLVQYILFPTLITDAKIFLDRGTIRMNLPGAHYMHIAFFLSVDRFFTTYKKKYAFGVALFFIVSILLGFRSTIALYILISTIFLLISEQVKQKILLFTLYATIVVSGFFAFQEIFFEMKESAVREGSQGTSYIRYRAAEHFLSLNNSDNLTYIIGNGEPSERSVYGRDLALISMMYGFYLSDIGIFGFYFKYGLISSLALLYVFFRVIFTKTEKGFTFLKLFFVFQLFQLPFSRTPFESLYSIVAICMLLYLFDVSLHKKLEPA